MLPQELLFGSDSAELHSFVQEVVVMAPLRHPNIVTLLGGSLQPPHVFLLEELCDASLDAWLHRGPAPPSRWRVLKVALDVAAGLQYLHGRQPPIVHRGGWVGAEVANLKDRLQTR
jgi:serine/threonine protein kinase